MLRQDEIIDARYRVEQVLGEGGMGVVYRARHVDLGTDVAIKVLRDEILDDVESVTRFAREGRAASLLRGPHVARVLDVGKLPSGAPYLVMEYLHGVDLSVELEHRGQLPVEEAVRYVVEACDAMREAHAAGIVHRDLKPANLFLAEVAGRRCVKVLDFGISRMVVPGDTRVTQTQASFGTPLYMSPEAIRSTKHVDERSDVWALGVILHELLSGGPPFLADTAAGVAVAISVDPPAPLRRHRPDVPEALEAVILRALEKSPDRRIASASELARLLEPFLGPRNSLVGTVPFSSPTTHRSLDDAQAPHARTVSDTSATVPHLAMAVAPEPTRRGTWGLVALGGLLGVGVVLASVWWFSARSHRAASALAEGAPSSTTRSSADSTPVIAPASSALAVPSPPSSNSSVTGPPPQTMSSVTGLRADSSRPVPSVTSGAATVASPTLPTASVPSTPTPPALPAPPAPNTTSVPEPAQPQPPPTPPPPKASPAAAPPAPNPGGNPLLLGD